VTIIPPLSAKNIAKQIGTPEQDVHTVVIVLPEPHLPKKVELDLRAILKHTLVVPIANHEWARKDSNVHVDQEHIDDKYPSILQSDIQARLALAKPGDVLVVSATGGQGTRHGSHKLKVVPSTLADINSLV